MLDGFADTILKPIAQELFLLVSGVPVSWAKVLFIALILGLALWVFFLKGEHMDPETNKPYPLHRDLRTWAILVLVLQAVGYMVLG